MDGALKHTKLSFPFTILVLMFNGKDWIQGVQLIWMRLFSQFIVTFAYQNICIIWEG